MSRLPTDWTCDRLKDVSAINADSMPADTDPDYEFEYLEISNVNYHGIVDPKAIERLRYEDAPSRARRRVVRNCTVISSVRPNLQAVAFLNNGRKDFVCSTGFNVVQPAEPKLSPKFAYYALISEGARQYFEATAKGVGYPAVDDKDFASFAVTLPPMPEQQRIAAYLDASCAAIDAAVAAKRRQLQTLDALRQSTIHRAVTRGIDECPKLKESDLEWLGSIPSHWAIRRIKDIAELRSGDAIAPEEIAPEGDYPVFGGNGLRGYTASFTHDGNYVLIGRQGALCGNINYANGKFWATEHAVVATLLKKIDTIWFGELLRTMNLNQYSNAAAQPGLAVDKIKFLRLPVPPPEEQTRIADHVQAFILKVESVASHLGKQIATLTAYRKSLIHECVTGQRRITEADVQRAAAQRKFDNLALTG
jgi:type I restriction enzyme, S subunit